MLFFNRAKKIEKLEKEISLVKTALLMGHYDSYSTGERKLIKLKKKLEKITNKPKPVISNVYTNKTIN